MAHQDPRDLIHSTGGRGYAQRVSLALPAWLGRPSPRLVDAGLAALVGIPVVASAIASGAQDDRALLGLVFGLATVVPLLFRRRWPFFALAAVLTAAVASPVDAQFVFPIAAMLYTIGSWRSWQATLAAAASVVATGLAYQQAGGPDLSTGDLATTAVLCGVAGGVGLYVSARRASVDALRDRAERLDRERELLADRAVAEERVRIAQELHDVVAHNVSLIVVKAQALGATVPDDRVAEATGGIADLGREAMAEMHRTLKLLRTSEDEAAKRAPQPGLANLDRLLEQSRAAGLDVRLAVEGEPRELSQSLDLSAFRIVQEALTNVRKHAGTARASVTVGYRPQALELSVVDSGDATAGAATAGAGAGAPGGHGLVGMRERATMFGGTLTARPLADRGFEVNAVLPYGEGRGA
jgi:signal transduction histidine kinase